MTDIELHLPINADFCAYSALKAEEVIRKSVSDDIQQSGKLLIIDRFVLKVPSQRFPEAVGVAYLLSYTIEIDMTLGEDEWKLVGFVKNEKYELSTKTVYSPGA